MTLRTFKLLTASTAFVAAASAGNAAVTNVSTNVTSTIYTSGTTGVNIIGSANVSTGSNAGILVSGTIGTPAAMPIGISSSATLGSSNSVGTIATEAGTNVTSIVINNSGTIVNTGAGAAINGTATQADTSAINLTVRNTGTISGTVDAGSNGLTYVGNGAIQRGNITGTGSAGTDSVTLTGSNMTGNVSLGNGINGLTVSNSTFTGNFTGGTTSDTVTIKDNSTFNGNINVAGATANTEDAITVTNSRVNGDISSGNGVTRLTLTNAIVSGTITDSQAGDSDVLTINGANTFTTMGAISGFEAVNLNANTNINHGLSGASTVSIGSGKSVNVNNSFQASGALTNAGTLNIAAGKSVEATTYTGTGGTLGIGLASSNTTTGVGRLKLTSGAATTNTSLTINVSANSGFIASGTQYLIVSGTTGTAVTSTLVSNANQGVYRFSTVANGNDLYLKVGRVSTSAIVQGSDNKSVAGVLDTLGNNSTGTLATVQGVIGQQSNAAGVENVLESLTPSIDGAGMASIGVTVDTGNQVSNRLASLRGSSGVATGDAMANKHMWVQGFGSTVSQDDRGGNSGYDASAGGVSLGVDTDTLMDGMTTGLALSYGRGSVDSNGAGNAKTDIDTYVATVYGSRSLDNGVFVNGQLAAGYNKYDMERNILGVGKATGDTNGWQGSAKLEAGKDIAFDKLTLTPLASLQYTYLNMDSYTETGAGGASLRVNPDDLSTVDAGAGAQVAYAIPLTDGGTLKPSAHAKYIYRMGDTEMGTTSNFTGGGASFNTTGVKADRSSVNLGAGLLLTTVGGTDLSLNYDADIRSNLTGHTGQLKARWAF